MAPKIYEARESFVTMLGDDQVTVTKGDLAEEGAPILRRRMDLFRPATEYIRFPAKERSAPVEQATKAPGEKRNVVRLHKPKAKTEAPRAATVADEVKIAATVKAEAKVSAAEAATDVDAAENSAAGD